MDFNRLSDPASTRKAPSPLDRFAALAGNGVVLLMTARFGRSLVRDAAYRFYDQRRDLDLIRSWRLFANLNDWVERWPAEQTTFAAGLILSEADDPVVERAVGRCLFDLAQLGRPLLWGVAGTRLGWYPQFKLSPNGWPPEEVFPHPVTYARLEADYENAEFCPSFNPILFLAEPDYFVANSRLRWREPRHCFVVRSAEVRDG